MTQEPLSENAARQREGLTRLPGVTFLIFFQAYMVAPMLPHLALEFHVSAQKIGLVVAAYLIPYGVSTLFYGLLSDRIGRRRIMLASLFAFAVLTALTATSKNSTQLILWRFLTGVGASGVVPLALALIGTLFPYEQRGRPLGWLFGAMAGGMAFGSTLGVLLEPFIGWRGLFLLVSGIGFLALGLLSRFADLLGAPLTSSSLTIRDVLDGYRGLLVDARARRTYIYVFLNSIFHSGVFTWLGLYFSQRYGLGEVGIGLTLLGYGIPGFLLGPFIGRLADRWGRRFLIPAGLFIATFSAAMLIVNLSLVLAAIAVTTLSLGYDMTQPLFAGIVTSLNQKRAGQAMGLNVFCLFTGFGVGSLLFAEALRCGLGPALGLFAILEVLLAGCSFVSFRSERAAYTRMNLAPTSAVISNERD